MYTCVHILMDIRQDNILIYTKSVFRKIKDSCWVAYLSAVSMYAYMHSDRTREKKKERERETVKRESESERKRGKD